MAVCCRLNQPARRSQAQDCNGSIPSVDPFFSFTPRGSSSADAAGFCRPSDGAPRSRRPDGRGRLVRRTRPVGKREERMDSSLPGGVIEKRVTPASARATATMEWTVSLTTRQRAGWGSRLLGRLSHVGDAGDKDQDCPRRHAHPVRHRCRRIRVPQRVRDRVPRGKRRKTGTTTIPLRRPYCYATKYSNDYRYYECP
jgi:hypothetical protein